jgi:uncharacterized DUF497 family protein
VSAPPWLKFEWDNANIEHIARHNYTAEEVEEVFAAAPRIRRLAPSRYGAYGATSDGRMTLVVFERRRGSIRTITAREMSEKERRAYRRK